MMHSYARESHLKWKLICTQLRLASSVVKVCVIHNKLYTNQPSTSLLLYHVNEVTLHFYMLGNDLNCSRNSTRMPLINLHINKIKIKLYISVCRVPTYPNRYLSCSLRKKNKYL